MAVEELKAKESEDTPQNPGWIRFDFKARGSAFFDIDMDSVFPLQMIVLGEYLTTLGKSNLLAEFAKAKEQATREGIQVAGSNVPPSALTRQSLKK